MAVLRPTPPTVIGLAPPYQPPEANRSGLKRGFEVDTPSTSPIRGPFSGSRAPRNRLRPHLSAPRGRPPRRQVPILIWAPPVGLGGCRVLALRLLRGAAGRHQTVR